MPRPTTAQQALTRFYARRPVAQLPELKEVLETTSRATVFRALLEHGYFTSYSHAGRFYTLRHIPDFDADGIWVCEDVLFSKLRTLRATLSHMVDQSPAGQTHAELHARVHLRAHNTLHDLVAMGRIRRLEQGDLFLYVSSNPTIAQTQLVGRDRLVPEASQPLTLPEPTVVIEILLALIRRPSEDADSVTVRLRRHGIRREQVDTVCKHYGVGKKKQVSGHLQQ